MVESYAITVDGMEYNIPKNVGYAIYRLIDRIYLKEDARRQLLFFIYGDDSENLTPAEKKKASTFFERKYNIAVENALELLDDFIEEFSALQDCNVAENITWENAIVSVLTR